MLTFFYFNFNGYMVNDSPAIFLLETKMPNTDSAMVVLDLLLERRGEKGYFIFKTDREQLSICFDGPRQTCDLLYKETDLGKEIARIVWNRDGEWDRLYPGRVPSPAIFKRIVEILLSAA